MIDHKAEQQRLLAEITRLLLLANERPLTDDEQKSLNNADASYGFGNICESQDAALWHGDQARNMLKDTNEFLEKVKGEGAIPYDPRVRPGELPELRHAYSMMVRAEDEDAQAKLLELAMQEPLLSVANASTGSDELPGRGWTIVETFPAVDCGPAIRLHKRLRLAKLKAFNKRKKQRRARTGRK